MSPDSQDATEAVETLEDLLQWELSADEWQNVDQILTEMIAALPAAPPALTARLELASPFRVPRVGRKPEGTLETSPPPPVRERTNQLIDALSSERKENPDRTKGSSPK